MFAGVVRAKRFMYLFLHAIRTVWHVSIYVRTPLHLHSLSETFLCQQSKDADGILQIVHGCSVRRGVTYVPDQPADEAQFFKSGIGASVKLISDARQACRIETVA